MLGCGERAFAGAFVEVTVSLRLTILTTMPTAQARPRAACVMAYG